MRITTLGLALALVLCGSGRAQEGPDAWEFADERPAVSKRRAVALSAVFPGLGQLAAGHRHKGTALVMGEVGFLVVWLTSHADYNTRKEQFDLETERYLALRQGGSFEAAEEGWKRLQDKKDDLDGSHTLRRLFGALAVGTYGYNLLDVLVLGGGEAAAPVSLEALPVPGEPGLALVWRF